MASYYTSKVIPGFIFMLFVLVAEGMPSGTPDISMEGSSTHGSSGIGSSTTMTIGKIFGHCEKLTDTNFEIWLAGLITALSLAPFIWLYLKS